MVGEVIGVMFLNRLVRKVPDGAKTEIGSEYPGLRAPRRKHSIRFTRGEEGGRLI